MTEPEVGMGGATVVELVTPVDHWLVTPIVVTVLWVVFEVVCVAGVTVVLLLSGSGDVEALLTAVVFVSPVVVAEGLGVMVFPVGFTVLLPGEVFGGRELDIVEGEEGVGPDVGLVVSVLLSVVVGMVVDTFDSVEVVCTVVEFSGWIGLLVVILFSVVDGSGVEVCPGADVMEVVPFVVFVMEAIVVALFAFAVVNVVKLSGFVVL